MNTITSNFTEIVRDYIKLSPEQREAFINVFTLVNKGLLIGENGIK